MDAVKKRRLIEIWSITVAHALTLLLLLIWIGAYVNGNSLVVTINEYGEKYPELIIWAVVVPALTVGLHNYLSRQWLLLNRSE